MVKQLILLIFLAVSGKTEPWLEEVAEEIVVELPQIKELLQQSIIIGEEKPSSYQKEEIDWQNDYNAGVKRNPMLESYQSSHQVRKRSPRCLRRCLRQQILHPAQCHSFCRAGF